MESSTLLMKYWFREKSEPIFFWWSAIRAVTLRVIPHKSIIEIGGTAEI